MGIFYFIVCGCVGKETGKKKSYFRRKTGEQENSGTRTKVGHIIGGMRKCRIVEERFRCRKSGFEDMIPLLPEGYMTL